MGRKEQPEVRQCFPIPFQVDSTKYIQGVLSFSKRAGFCITNKLGGERMRPSEPPLQIQSQRNGNKKHLEQRHTGCCAGKSLNIVLPLMGSTPEKNKFCIIFSYKIITLIYIHSISRKLALLSHKMFFASYLCCFWLVLTQELHITYISGPVEFKVIIMAFKKREGWACWGCEI